MVGLFSYYAKWIPNFSAKIKPLSSNKRFPLPDEVLHSFKVLKNDIIESVVCAINESKPFVILTDALSQGGRPESFFSRTLDKGLLRKKLVLLLKQFVAGDIICPGDTSI